VDSEIPYRVMDCLSVMVQKERPPPTHTTMTTTLYQNSVIELGQLTIDPRTVDVDQDTDLLPYHFIMDNVVGATDWDTVFQDVTYRHIRHPADASTDLDTEPGMLERWQSAGLPKVFIESGLLGQANKAAFDTAHRNCIVNMVDFYLSKYVAIGGDSTSALAAPSAGGVLNGTMNPSALNSSNLDINGAGPSTVDIDTADDPVNDPVPGSSLLTAAVNDLVPTWDGIIGAANMSAHQFSLETPALGGNSGTGSLAINAGMDLAQVERLVEFWGTTGKIYETAMAAADPTVRNEFPDETAVSPEVDGMGPTLPLKKVNFVEPPSLSCTYAVQIEVDRNSLGDSATAASNVGHGHTFTDKTFTFTSNPSQATPTPNVLNLRVKYS
jgi:hypothetical protein